LISEGFWDGIKVIEGGPHLNLVGIPLGPWLLDEIRAKPEEGAILVTITGKYGAIRVGFNIRIFGNGELQTTYTLLDLPFSPPRARKLGVGLDVGGYREVGVAFTLPETVDRLLWERNGLWSAYPSDHLGRNSGIAYKLRSQGKETFGVKHTWSWGEDMREYSLFGRYDVGGRGTRDFFSMKHHITLAAALIEGKPFGVKVESNGCDSIRMEILPSPASIIDERDERVRFVGSWIPVNDDRKNFQATEMITNKGGDFVEFPFRGTGICWVGAKDLIYGMANVYLDGILQTDSIDLFYSMPISTSWGEEKLHQQILFSAENLEDQEHLLRIIATGKKNPRAGNAYISVDAFAFPESLAHGQYA